MAEEQPFPYGLVLNKPIRLVPVQGCPDGLVFATVSDDLGNSCNVTGWPVRELGLRLAVNSVLRLHIFAARDAAAFQRGDAQLQAELGIPLHRVALEVAQRPHGARELFDIWLNLDTAPGEASSREGLEERFEQSRQAASREPWRPKIQLLVDTAGPGPLVASSASGTPTQRCSPRAPVPQLALGGIRPQTEVALLPRSDGPLSMEEGSLSSRSEGDDAAGQEAPEALTPRTSGPSPRLEAAATGHGSSWVALDTSAAPAHSGKECSDASRSPARSPVVSAREGGSDRAQTNSDEMKFVITWHQRFTDERERGEKMQTDFDRLSRNLVTKEIRQKLAFSRVTEFMFDRRRECITRSVLLAWHQWMSDEKNDRQFEQLSNEFEHDRGLHEAQKLEWTGSLESRQKLLEQHVNLRRARLSRAQEESSGIEACWARREGTRVLSKVFTAWRRRSERLKVERRVFSWFDEAAAIPIGLHRTFQVWCAQTRRTLRETLLQESNETAAQLPVYFKRESRSQTAALLGRAFAKRASNRRPVAMDGAFHTWLRVAQARSHWRGGTVLLLGLVPQGALSFVLLVRCVAAWRCTVDFAQTSAFMQKERDDWADVISELHRCAMSFVHIAQGSGCGEAVNVAFLCWRDYVSGERISRALEQMLRERGAHEDSFGSFEAEHDAERDAASIMQRSQDEEHAAMHTQLREVRSELEAAQSLTEERMQEHADLEQHRDVVVSQNQQLTEELETALREKHSTIERLLSTHDACERASVDARKRESECETNAEQLALKREQLLAEGSRDREGRLADLKAIKAEAKAELSSQESTVQRVMEARASEQRQWTSELRESDQKRKDVEKEIRALRGSGTAAAPKEQVDFEAERQALQQRTEVAEAKLKRLVAASRDDSELDELRQTCAEANSRASELEAAVVGERGDLSIIPPTLDRMDSTGSLAGSGGGSPLASRRLVHEKQSPRMNRREQSEEDLRVQLDSLDDFQRVLRSSSRGSPQDKRSLSPVGGSSSNLSETKAAAAAAAAAALEVCTTAAGAQLLPPMPQLPPLPNYSTSINDFGEREDGLILGFEIGGLEQTLSQPSSGTRKSPRSFGTPPRSPLRTGTTPPVGSNTLPSRSRAKVASSSGATSPKAAAPNGMPSLQGATSPDGGSPDRASVQPSTRPRPTTTAAISDSAPNRTPSPQDATGPDGGSPEAASVQPSARPRPTTTSAKAALMWRQRTLSQHNAERRNLKEKVEQMKQKIDAERAEAVLRRPATKAGAATRPALARPR